MAVLALIVPLGSTGGPVDPGFGVPAPPSGGGGAPVYPSHPDLPCRRSTRARGCPVYPRHQGPVLWPAAGAPVIQLPDPRGLPVYPSHRARVPPPPLGIWGPGQMPAGRLANASHGGSGGGGGSGAGGEITNPIGGGFVLVWHPVRLQVVPGGRSPSSEPGPIPRARSGLASTAEPKGSSSTSESKALLTRE